MSSHTVCDYAVIGGGISGLLSAYRILQRTPGARITVYEAAPQTGGCLKASSLAGFAPEGADVGAEASLYVRSETKALAAELGLELAFPSRTHRSQLYAAGALHPIPADTLMGVPSHPESLAGIVSAAGIDRAQREDLSADFPVVQGEEFDTSAGEFLAARLGDEIVDAVIDPLLAGVYSGRARDLSLRATLPSLLPAAQHTQPVTQTVADILAQRSAQQGANIPGTRPQAPPVFMSLPGGINRLSDALTEAVTQAGGEVLTSTRVTRLARETAGYRLSWVSGTETGEHSALRVIIATPVSSAAELLAGLAHPGTSAGTGSGDRQIISGELAAAAAELGRIPAADSAVVTTVLKLAEPLNGSGFLVSAAEDAFIKASTFASNKWPWLSELLPENHAVVRMSLGRYGDAPGVWEHLDDDALAERAIADWLRLTARQDIVLHAEVQRWLGALPQYLPGHAERIRRVDAAIAQLKGLALVGNVYAGVGIPACIARVEAELARLSID